MEYDQITSADYEGKQEGVDQKVVLVIEDAESSFDRNMDEREHRPWW